MTSINTLISSLRSCRLVAYRQLSLATCIHNNIINNNNLHNNTQHTKQLHTQVYALQLQQQSVNTTNNDNYNNTIQYNPTLKPIIPVKPKFEQWHLIDATGIAAGRLAVYIARILQGKHRPDYTPHIDKGDHVVVLNVDKIHLSGKKWQQKIYYKHSGYPGGLHETPAYRMLENHPDWILRKAVAGNIPMNKHKKPRLARLKCYVGTVHPHTGQFPVNIPLPSEYLTRIANDEQAEEQAAIEKVLKSDIAANSIEWQPKLGGQKHMVRDEVYKEKKELRIKSRKANE